MAGRAALLLLLSACRPEGAPRPSDVAAVPAPRLGTPSADPMDVPPGLGQLTEASNALIAGARALNADPVPALYEEAVGWSEGTCPNFQDLTATAIYWESICDTGDGAHFQGDGFYSILDGVNDDGWTYHRHELFTHSWITAADGAVFRGAGNLFVQELTGPEGQTSFESTVLGTFIATSALADGLWISEGVENNLMVILRAGPDGQPTQVLIDGSVGGLPGAFGAAAFDGFKLDSEHSAWGCPGEPSGTLSMRWSDGTWVTFTFDTVDDLGTAPEDPDLCDGCGTATWEGQELGQVCFDFSPLFDWEGAPW